MNDKTRVTIWHEFRHEKNNDAVKKMYPDGMHMALSKGLQKQFSDLDIRTATLDEAEHGLTEDVINNTDVMTWWGHCAHGDVDDAIVRRVHKRVLEGMGLIVLHSGHFSKIFKSLMGTNCSLTWREVAEKERLWNIAPNHPITQGIGPYLELPNTEMYGERFDIPEPDQQIFISWFEGGEVFRSGCVFYRGHGKVFYFRPGHETYPIYYNDDVIRIIGNACRWAKPLNFMADKCPNVQPLEEISEKELDFGRAGILQNS